MAAQDYYGVVQQLYVSYFGRPADYYGLQNFAAQLDAMKAPTNFADLQAAVQADATHKSALSVLVNSFNSSAESVALYGSDNSQIGISKFVAAIYQNVLGREADKAGFDFWVGAITSGTLSKANAAAAITQAALTNNATDAATVTNKLAVATSFTANLDTPTEIVAFSGDAAAAASRALLASVNNTTDLTAYQTNITNSILNIVAANNPGQVFTLTSGVDAFIGTSGNDTFNALPTTAGATLTALDKIDGGAGNDTLSIVDTAAASNPFTVPTTATVANIETASITSANNNVTADVSGWTGLKTVTVASSSGATVTAATTTATTVTDANLTTNSMSVTGGSDVTVTATAAGTGATVSVAGATGNVAVNVNAKGAGNVSVGSITVNGGKTVVVTETASPNATPTSAGGTVTQGAVVVTGTAATTAVTVNQAAPSTGAAGVKEVFTATVGTGAGANTDTITFDGVVYTASGALSATATATAFATAYNAASGTHWVAVDNGNGTVTFTAKSAAAVTDIVTSNFAVNGTVAVSAAAPTTQGTGAQSVANGTVTINDLNAGSTSKAATISTVTLTNYANSTISSNALANLNLSGTGGTLGLTSGLSTETVKTLNLNVNALTSGVITDSSNHFTTINVVTAGKDSTIAGIGDTAATALKVSGTNALTLTAATGMTTLATVSVSGAAGLTADVSGIATVTDVNASASSGANNITLNAGNATFEGGSGVDTVTVTVAPTKTIDGGAGSADTIVLKGNGLLTLASGAKLVNFENIDTTGGGGAFDLSQINGITGLKVGAATADLAFTNVGANTSLSLVADPTVNVAYALKTDTASDAVTLNLATSSASGVNFTGHTVSIGAIETVNIVSNGKVSSGVSAGTNQLALTDTAATKLVVSGAESLTLTGLTSNTVTSVDATGVAAGATFKLITAATATAGATVTAKDGNLWFTGAAAAGKVDTITAGNGNNTITEGAGDNSITLGNGTNSVTVGNGTNTISVGSGANTIVLGTGQNTVTVAAHDASKVDNITFGTATTANTYSTATGLQKGDVLNFADAGTEVWLGSSSTAAQIKLNASTALFADYIQAATAGDGSANAIFSWFQFNGNTYVVEDKAAGNAFVAGTDNIVKLTGLVDLSKSTLGDHIITLG